MLFSDLHDCEYLTHSQSNNRYLKYVPFGKDIELHYNDRPIDRILQSKLFPGYFTIYLKNGIDIHLTTEDEFELVVYQISREKLKTIGTTTDD